MRKKKCLFVAGGCHPSSTSCDLAMGGIWSIGWIDYWNVLLLEGSQSTSWFGFNQASSPMILLMLSRLYQSFITESKFSGIHRSSYPAFGVTMRNSSLLTSMRLSLEEWTSAMVDMMTHSIESMIILSLNIQALNTITAEWMTLSMWESISNKMFPEIVGDCHGMM